MGLHLGPFPGAQRWILHQSRFPESSSDNFCQDAALPSAGSAFQVAQCCVTGLSVRGVSEMFLPLLVKDHPESSGSPTTI